MIPAITEIRIRSENPVEIARENLNFFSSKLANGTKRSAIRNAKNKGDKIVCPIFAKYPKISTLIRTRVILRIKGSFRSFICVLFDYFFFEKRVQYKKILPIVGRIFILLNKS